MKIITLVEFPLARWIIVICIFACKTFSLLPEKLIFEKECNMLISLPLSFSAYRLSETERRSGAGALPGRYLPLSNHLSGLPHAHSARQVGRGLWLRKAATPSHLPQPGLHGTAAAVWDWRPLSGMKNQAHSGRWNTHDFTFPPAVVGIVLDSEHYQDSGTNVLFVLLKVVSFRSVCVIYSEIAMCAAGSTYLAGLLWQQFAI